MLRHLLPLLLLAPAMADDEPAPVPYIAAEARLFLKVPDRSPPLANVRVSSGQAMPAVHESDSKDRDRLTDISFPIQWWRWREFVITFTPAHTGTVELDLNGPWGEFSPGALKQQEVLWDELSVEGGALSNGGFEDQQDGKPAGWDSPWRPYPDAGTWPLTGNEPLEGKSLAASWHGRPLVRSIEVKQGVQVTLRMHARAATVPGFKKPAILPKNTPAHQACAGLKRGMNLGNHWEAPPGGWGIRYDVGDIDLIAAQGFDHIRVPVAWHYHMEDGRIKAELLAELEPVLKRALEKKLRVIVNWHHYEALCKEPQKHRADFRKGWQVIAEHFKDWPEELYLELLNEPNGELDHGLLTEIHAEAISAIRMTNPRRILLVNPPRWGNVRGLDQLFLPDADDRIIASFHSYEPFEFTHQQAPWVNLQDLRGISYPGPPPKPVILPESLRANNPTLVQWIEAYNTRKGSDNPCTAATFSTLLDDAVAWSDYFGRPVHIGEFGAFQKADAGSRSRYIRDFREAAEKRKLPWALWEWKAGFGYWDSAQAKPLLREALFEGS